MKPFNNIRSLYTPIQPAVRNIADSVVYVEYLPDEKLRDYIFCYWQLRTTTKLTSLFNYRVVADGCVDIFFEPGKQNENFVMGFCKKYTVFPLKNAFNYVGVRFLPTMFPQLFKINAAEIANAAIELNSILPQVSGFIESSFIPWQSID